MNRSMRRASEKEGRRLQGLEWNKFEDITSELKRLPSYQSSSWKPDIAYKNNHYIVQIGLYDRVWMTVPWHRVMVRRSDAKPIMSWPDMQRIKNEIFGDEIEAIQFLPKQSALVDSANLYWFFIQALEPA